VGGRCKRSASVPKRRASAANDEPMCGRAADVWGRPPQRVLHCISMRPHAVLAAASNRPGLLFGLTKVLADHDANITSVDIVQRDDRGAEIYLEFETDAAIEPILDGLRQVAGVTRADATPSFKKIYGKRIVIMGGGAQVGQVALGAISEADR